MEFELARARVVFDTIISKSPDPIFTDFTRWSSITFEGIQDRDGIFVRNRKRWDRGLVPSFKSGCILVGRFARSTGIAWVLG
jgi:hypothetical protein